jgi:hypothetical protein
LTVVEPLLNVLERHVFAPSAENPQAVVEAAQRIIRDLLFELYAAASEEQRQSSIMRLLGILESSPHVGPSFWLSAPVSDNWPPGFRQAVIDRATQTMAEPNAPAAHVAQASMILKCDPQLTIQKIEVLSQSINDRLINLSRTPQRMLARVEVSRYFYKVAIPSTSNEGLSIRLAVSGSRGLGLGISSTVEAHASETLAILELTKLLSADADFTRGLHAVRKATTEASEIVSEAVQSARSEIRIDWPSFKFKTGPSSLQDTVNSLSPEQIMAYVIHRFAGTMLTEADKNIP